ncbi:MAG: nuclear transport factor 2 family protein [Pseudoxanthomonas sp.]
MKTHALLLLAMLLASPLVSAQEGAADAALEAEIRALDLAHAKAIFEGDAKALDALMDDEVTVNHPTGRIVKEKKELLDLIRQGVIRYTAFERTPERFLYFPDMVVVMGGEVVVPAPGAPNAGQRLQRRYTNAWMKRDGKWRLAFRHANNVCAPKPAG